MSKRWLFLLLAINCSLLTINCGAQNIDSLWTVFNNKTKPDTIRFKALHAIAWNKHSNNPDSGIILAEQELAFANAMPNGKGKRYTAKAYNIMGLSYISKSDYPKALTYLLKSLSIAEEVGNKQGMGVSYTNIGNVYYYESNYPKALEYFQKSLKIAEEIGSKKDIGSCYNNIGEIYRIQFNYPKALEYYEKSLPLFNQGGDKLGLGHSYSNMGIVYYSQNNNPKALEYYLKALETNKGVDDKQGMSLCYDKMSELYNRTRDYKLALSCSQSAFQLSKETGDMNELRYAYENTATAYAKMGNYKEAYENHVMFKQVNDSIFNADNSKQLGDIKTKFEVERKEAELKIKSDAEQEKLKAIAHEEKKRQQVIIAAVAGVLVIVIIFSLFLYKRFRLTQKQKTVIENQKVLVDKAYEELHEKNKEVMDSIRYAKKIQTALITSERYFENSLKRLISK